jgi:hypothetical protein
VGNQDPHLLVGVKRLLKTESDSTP